MRHMSPAGAKCGECGDMSETDALKAITLNGAKQLGLEKRVGSIEVGKDADLAIFNGHPLNSYSRCEMTLVEGEVFFQRGDKLVPFDAASTEPAKQPAKFPVIPELPKGTYVLRGGTIHQPGKPAFI